ncbi:MAG TPA: GAF and ANTAR domain-containing protein [Aquihabitans sp.]|nr:GAF and ANTAR domain-containing protein [Aquihabitans sp.]
MSDSPHADALRALTRFLVTDATVGDTLDQMAAITDEALPSACMVGMTMHDDRGRPATRVFTDPAAREVDEAQYRAERGPCLDAWRLARVVRVDDLGEFERTYPEFRVAAEANGVGSSLSIPLLAGEVAVGALNLYGAGRAAFSDADESLGVDLAAAMAVVLSNATAYWGAFELSQQLHQAIASRAAIEQAKGMLMARSPGLSPDGAFDLLRRASQRENTKLHDIADRIVAGGGHGVPAD